MTLTVHHLNKSQSERVVWLCEELGIDYELKLHDRNAETALAPPELKTIHQAGTAPIITDGSDVVLAESGAIIEYIVHVHGGGRLAAKPGDKNYADYLAYVHFANGTLQNAMGRNMMVLRMGDAIKGMPFVDFVEKKLDNALQQIEEQLGKTGAYLAGSDLTAADIMTVFSLSTMRGFYPKDLSPYPNILRYLQQVGKRPAYKKAMEKGDPGLEPLLGAKVEPFQFGKR